MTVAELVFLRPRPCRKERVSSSSSSSSEKGRRRREGERERRERERKSTFRTPEGRLSLQQKIGFMAPPTNHPSLSPTLLYTLLLYLQLTLSLTLDREKKLVIGSPICFREAGGAGDLRERAREGNTSVSPCTIPTPAPSSTSA